MDEPVDAHVLAALTNAQLAQQCEIEQKRYHLHLPSDDRYCLALLRRGIAGDQDAWRLFQEHFAGSVLVWLRQHPSTNRVSSGAEEDQELVNDTFSKFWQAVAPSRAEFSSLAKALAFLKRCLNSVVIDRWRGHKPIVEIPPDHPTPEHDPEKRPAEEELWNLIRRILPDRREQKLVRLLWVEDYKPGEVARLFPQDFPDVQAVYQLSRSLRDRLLHHPLFRRWFAEELQRLITYLLSDRRERLLTYLMLFERCEPDTIVQRYRQDFPTVEEVTRLWQDILTRLKSNSRFRRWFGEENR